MGFGDLIWGFKRFPPFRLAEFVIGMCMAIRVQQDGQYLPVPDGGGGAHRDGPGPGPGAAGAAGGKLGAGGGGQKSGPGAPGGVEAGFGANGLEAFAESFRPARLACALCVAALVGALTFYLVGLVSVPLSLSLSQCRSHSGHLSLSLCNSLRTERVQLESVCVC